MLSVATIDAVPDRSAAIWVTDLVPHARVAHTNATTFDDLEQSHDDIHEELTGRFVYAPTEDARQYVRTFGFSPLELDNLRDPALTLGALVRGVAGVAEPTSAVLTPPVLDTAASRTVTSNAQTAANHLLAVWQFWLDVESRRAHLHEHLPPDLASPAVRPLPDEFVLAELPA